MVLSVPAAIVTVAVGYLMTVASTEQELLTHDVHAAAFSYATSKMFAAITVVDVLDVLWSESATFPVRVCWL